MSRLLVLIWKLEHAPEFRKERKGAASLPTPPAFPQYW